MCITTRGVGTFSTKEMKTSRNSFWCWIVGKIAEITCCTLTFLEKIFAYCDGSWVMNVGAKWSLKTLAYEIEKIVISIEMLLEFQNIFVRYGMGKGYRSLWSVCMARVFFLFSQSPCHLLGADLRLECIQTIISKLVREFSRRHLPSSLHHPRAIKITVFAS